MPTESLAELVRFAPDVYGFRWQNHVALFIVTGEGVVLCDPIGWANARAPYVLKEAVRAVTDQPVQYVVYSHWGADHGMGGDAFADTAQFVGHVNVVDRIKRTETAASPLPTIVFDQPMALELGGRKIDLYPADLADNDDYIVLHDPASRVAMLVDIVQPQSTAFRHLLGHPDRIIERLEWLQNSLDFDVLVSGHATPRMTCTKEEVAEQIGYYRDLTNAIAAAQGEGLAADSPELVTAVKAALQPKYGTWRRFDDALGLNIEGMIAWRSGKNMRTT